MALGRGLSSLIPAQRSTEQTAAADISQSSVRFIPIAQIAPNPHQPRQHFSHAELENLIQSVIQHGILQPLLVSPVGVGQYELIAGERRLRAAKMAGLDSVPVLVRDVADLEKVELALIENIQRSDLNPVEKAEAYRKLLNEFGLNHEEAAKKLGIPRSSFSNTLRVLELPGELQSALADGKISEGHAKVLLGLPNTAEQKKYFQLIQTDQLSVQRLSRAVTGKTKQRHRSARPSHVAAYEEELSLTLGTKVTIQPNRIVIQYYSPEELTELVKKITK